MNKSKAVDSAKNKKTEDQLKGSSVKSNSKIQPASSSSSSSNHFGSLKRFKKIPVSSSTPKKSSPFFTSVNSAPNVSSTTRIGDNANLENLPSTRNRRAIVKDVEKIQRNKEITSNLKEPNRKIKVKSLQNIFVRKNPPTTTSIPLTGKPKRPATVSIPNTRPLSVRRGHKDGQNNHPDNISHSSSITNLDSLESNLQRGETGGKGAKPRKASSKERIDNNKQFQQDVKKLNKNNNKLEPPVSILISPSSLSYSADSLHETELQQLRKQLREMADEKSSLALQLGEQRGQLNVLQKEVLKLKTVQEESNLEMEKLAEENTALRNRLRDVAHSPLSDNEKQQLLFESRHHSSAPASIATNVVDDNGGGDTGTACTTPDWDKHSSGNISEVSAVACLQDKINQMQETHYSTNEELQATLQELTDLQRQLTELQQENERLNDEKTLMFDSLCRQTERLTDSRQEVENLKQFLYRDKSDETGVNHFESAAEREQQLVELLRSAQEEREQLLIKLDQIQAELHDSRAVNVDKTETVVQLTERVKTLEYTLDAKHAEHKQLDQELAQAKDQSSGKQIEINRLSNLLENARTKITELEQDRTLSDKSELDELLDNARKEKDQLESEITYLREQLARSKNELEKLKEQVFVLQEECKVTRNNAKSTQSDLEYKLEKIAAEKSSLNDQLQQFQEAVNELQVQAQCHLEDKRQLSAVLSETQRNMSEAERKNLNLETELNELKKLRAEENDEWEKFQNDLLTSVRVANDFKTEAQQELQKIILENKTYREKVRLLEGQIEKLKDTHHKSASTQTDIILSPQIVAIARNVDISAVNRYSRNSEDNSNSSRISDMDKLFPILSKDRKSKSRENLTEIQSRSGSSRHNDKLKNALKRSKSRDDLQELQNDDKTSGNRRFFSWNKSKESLNHHQDETKFKKGFLKRHKSKDNLDNLSSDENKFLAIDKIKCDSKAEFFTKFIKKRDKKPENRLKFEAQKKFLSVEEETLLKSLDSWYDQIDDSIPNEMLSEENRAIRKLKLLYNDETLKEKPIAHKPKESLAISKPLLQSVINNPKLKEIFGDPKLQIIVDNAIRQSALEDVADSAPDVVALEELDEDKVNTRNVSSILHHNRKPSEIHPSDSISNPRYSKQSNLPKPNIYINYENLDDIVASIPKGLVDNKLTEEQKFARKLKQALDDAEQATLRRIANNNRFRNMEISAPTEDSVKKNYKLKEIILNPGIKFARKDLERKRHSTDISSDLGSPTNELKNSSSLEKSLSKSYEQISFSFVPENTLLNNKYFKGDIEKSKYFSNSSSSFTSAEFNVETGDIVKKCDISMQDCTADDLLYNETLNKNDPTNKSSSNQRHSKEIIQKIINDLSQQVEDEEEEVIHHPKILNARNKYKKELEQVLRRLEQDELRKSVRKHRQKIAEDSSSVTKFVLAENNGIQEVFKVQINNPADEKLFEYPNILQESASLEIIKLEEPETIQYNISEYFEDPIIFETANINEEALEELKFEHVCDEEPKLKELIPDALIVEKSSIEDLQFESATYDKEENRNSKEEKIVLEKKVHKLTLEDIQFESPLLKDIFIENSRLESVLEAPSVQEYKVQSYVIPCLADSEIVLETSDLKTFEVEKKMEDLTVSPYYSHYNTIRENQYGVNTPKVFRTTYRNVVKEFKNKYPLDDDVDGIFNENAESSVADEYNQYQDDNVEDFFKPVNYLSNINVDNNNEEKEITTSLEVSQIDLEMEAIMEKYLKTSSSILINTAETSLKITENVEKIDDNIEDPNICDKAANENTVVEDRLSIEEIQFIEEMKKKYSTEDLNKSAEDNLLLNPKRIRRRPLSEINYEDLKLIEEISNRNMDEEHQPEVSTPKPSLIPRKLISPKSSNAAARLSDLIFNETIFVPLENNNPKPHNSKIPVKIDSSNNNKGREINNTPPSASGESSPVTPTKENWSDSLKRGLLDSKSTYIPVFDTGAKLEKLLLPLSDDSYLIDDHHVTNSSNTMMALNHENSSEVGIKKTPEIDENVDINDSVDDSKPANMSLVEQSKARTDIFKTDSDKTTLEIGEPFDDIMDDEGKIILLPLDDDVEEIPRAPSSQDADSHINLFHVDSEAEYDSYLELFKTKESKDFDLLRGKNPHKKGFFAFVEEVVDEDENNPVDETDDDEENTQDAHHQAIPKIVDFVPLDDINTTPVFTKEPSSSSSGAAETENNTLEREQTYHILGQASNLDKNDVASVNVVAVEEKTDLQSSVEILAAKNSSNFSKTSSKSHTDEASRTSFTQARKIFEALAEANRGRPKSAIGPKSASGRLSNIRDSKSVEQVKNSNESFNNKNPEN